MNNNYETVSELLNKKHENQNLKSVKAKKEKTKKSKKFLVGIVALVAAGAIALTSGIAVVVNHFKKKNNDVPKTPDNSIVQIDDMGTELEFPENNTSKYGETTGKVNKDEIVEKNGKLYVNKESADKADKKGTSSIDTKGDTLVVEDGKVKEKAEGIEVIEKNGNVIIKEDLDENGIPDGYAWDSILKKYIPEEEVGKYVYADATYYFEDGSVALIKGDIVSKETLEKAKKYLSTTKPTKTTSSSSNTTTSSTTTSSTTDTSSKTETSSTTTTSSEGKVNADGTYTIYDITFLTKADFEQWVIDGGEGYAKDLDGIMKPVEQIDLGYQYTK